MSNRTPRLLRPTVLLLSAVLLLCFSFNLTAQPPAQDGGTPESPVPLDSLSLDTLTVERLSTKPPIPSLSSDLYQLLQTWKADPASGRELADTLELEVQADQVAVMLVMLDSAAVPAAISAIQAAGGLVTAQYDRWIDALVPVLALENLAQLPRLSIIQRIIETYPVDSDLPNAQMPNDDVRAAGTYNSQGVAASNASAWHTAGITGSGVTVGILDSFLDFATAQTNGEVPPAGRVSTVGTLSTSSRHGTAVAEIVYDMAPGVSMILVSPSSATQMASRITELANYPAGSRPKIITSSIGFYNAEPGDGSGSVSQAIDYAVSQGVLYTQAAGNQALGNYQAAYNDTDADGWHNFSGVAEVNLLNNGLSIPAGTVINIFLRWNDWQTSDQDFDLYLFDCTSACTAIAWSTNEQSGTQPPTEQIYGSVPSAGLYGYAIYKYAATENVILDFMGHNLPTAQFRMADRSLVDPATGTGAFGVAALNSASPYTLESYSSQGPALGTGGTLNTGNAQPRLAGFANVDTWSYGLGFFNGTSSATPHVAGAAALIFQRFPAYTPADVKNYLETNAVDMGTAGYDYIYGAGRLWLGSPPVTPTNTPTNTPTFTPTNTWTPTPSNTPTSTNTWTPTPTATSTQYKTPTPILLSPFDTIDTRHPNFRWTAVADGAWYYLWIDSSTGHVLDQWYDGWSICNATECNVTPSIELAGGSYQWYVQAWTLSGDYSTWSNPGSINLAVQSAIPISPIGGTTETQPTFTWTGTSETGWYYLWIEGPSGHVLDQWYDGGIVCASGTCSVTPVLSLVGGTYQWWVQMWTQGNGYHPWSSGVLFSVNLPPPAPTQIEPTGTISTSQPTFRWNAVPAGAWYYLWVSGTNGHVLDQWFDASNCVSNVCSVTPSLNLADGAYQWWVQAWSSEGGYGVWSDTMSFTVVTVAGTPEVMPPELLPPVGGELPVTPEFSPGVAADLLARWRFKP
jgi:subtilisin family serine protease